MVTPAATSASKGVRTFSAATLNTLTRTRPPDGDLMPMCRGLPSSGRKTLSLSTAGTWGVLVGSGVSVIV